MRIIRRQGTFTEAATGKRSKGIDRHIATHIFTHIESSDFPCAMAKTATANDALSVSTYLSMSDSKSIDNLYADIKIWLASDFEGDFRTFVAMFAEDYPSDQAEYHEMLWSALSTLRGKEPCNRIAPVGTSDDIESSDFAFAVHGEAFFIVGLSPHSPRYARRTAFAGFALNLHSQFELLRERGIMERTEGIIRKRDTALQGDINPLLSAHGNASAALQYSSKVIDDVSECPYKH